MSLVYTILLDIFKLKRRCESLRLASLAIDNEVDELNRQKDLAVRDAQRERDQAKGRWKVDFASRGFAPTSGSLHAFLRQGDTRCCEKVDDIRKRTAFEIRELRLTQQASRVGRAKRNPPLVGHSGGVRFAHPTLRKQNRGGENAVLTERI